MKKIRILYTINFINNGGPSKVLLNQIKELDRNRFEIYVMTIINENNTSIIDGLKKTNVNVIEFHMNKRITDVLKYRKKILNKIKEISPDIIHTHGIVTSLIVSSKKIKAKKITTVHNNIFCDYKYTYGPFKGIVIALVHISALKRFDKVVCCSKTSYDVVKKYLKNSSFIRNGIDASENFDNHLEIRRRIRQELNISDDSVVYIYCGVLTKRKNVEGLISQFNKELNNNEYLIVLGDGPEKEKLKQIASNKRIKFLGYKSNVMDYYMMADIYTSFSKVEGFSISIIEALSCNLLLLLNDIPSHRECFEIDDNMYIGELFTLDNFFDKKKLISKKIDNSISKQFYEKHLSSKIMMKHYINLYGEINETKN